MTAIIFFIAFAVACIAFVTVNSCSHEWVILDKIEIYEGDDEPGNRLPVAMKYHLQCKKCGAIKKKKL